MPFVVSDLLRPALALSAALSLSCASVSATGPDVTTTKTDAGVFKRGLAKNAEARRAAAVEVIHLDGIEEKVIGLSSLDAVLAQSFRGAFLRDIDAPSSGLSLAARSRLDIIARAARRVYRGDALRRELVERLVDRPGAAHLEEVLAFLKGSSWRRLADARAYLRTRSGQKALANFLTKEASRPPDEAKLAHVRELLQASSDVELMRVLSFGATRSALEALESTLPKELSVGFERWLDSQRTSEESFERDITRTLLLQDYFALHALDQRQLDDVIRFWRSDAGRWWAHARVDETRDLVDQRARLLKQTLERTKDTQAEAEARSESEPKELSSTGLPPAPAAAPRSAPPRR